MTQWESAWQIVLGGFMRAWGIFFDLIGGTVGVAFFIGTTLSLLAIHKFIDIFVSNFIGSSSFSDDAKQLGKDAARFTYPSGSRRRNGG